MNRKDCKVIVDCESPARAEALRLDLFSRLKKESGILDVFIEKSNPIAYSAKSRLLQPITDPALATEMLYNWLNSGEHAQYVAASVNLSGRNKIVEMVDPIVDIFLEESLENIISNENCAKVALAVFPLLEKAKRLTPSLLVMRKRIQPFLFPLPVDGKYEKLRLLQKIVRSYLSIELLLQNPRLVDGALQSAFSDYKRQYAEQYMNEFRVYMTAAKEGHEYSKKLQKMIEATCALDEIEALGPPLSRIAMAELDTFFATNPYTDVAESVVRARVESDGFWESFVLGTPPPDEAFVHLKKSIEGYFTKKVSQIKTETIDQIMSESENSAAQKLLSLLQLSHIDQMVELLVEDKSGRVISGLREILMKGR